MSLVQWEWPTGGFRGMSNRDVHEAAIKDTIIHSTLAIQDHADSRHQII